jgi:putative intracellular protease/amidase
MKNAKPRAFGLISLVVMLLAIAFSAARAHSAAMLTPCEEQVVMQAANSKPGIKLDVAAAAKRTAPRNLVIFIFDGVQIIDYAGPFEVLGQAHDGDQNLFNIYTVAEKAGPITTNMGMTVVPKYTFNTMPQTDVLLLPGGDTRRPLANPKVIKWVQDTSARSEYVMSVCNGAFYLAKAGLLDGLGATTFYRLIDELQTMAPKAHVVSDQRFVDNGKIITTAGLSSGIDGALHLIEKIAGRGRAQEVALNLEYNWQPDIAYARASFADRHLRKVLGPRGFKLPEGSQAKVLGQTGGKEAWEKTWEVRSNVGAAELLKAIDTNLSEGWTMIGVDAGGENATSVWKFSDEDSKQWNALAAVEPTRDPRLFHLSIKLARVALVAKSQGE